MHANLPAAVDAERSALIQAAIRWLEGQGCRRFRVHGHAGYADPEPLRISVLNIVLVPDIHAEEGKTGAPVVACVEVSSDLSEMDCGRYWQALESWAREHGGRFYACVHADDAERARRIAQHWHLEPSYLRPVAAG
jgi:hypothetical protein